MDTTNIKVLVIDDIASARKIVVRLLGKLGISNVFSAEKGEEAIDLAIKEEVDLIISDLHLKDMDGIDVFRGLQEANDDFKVPFIVMTSDMNREEFDRVIQEGVSAYLLKPFSLKDLRNIVSKAIPQKAA